MKQVIFLFSIIITISSCTSTNSIERTAKDQVFLQNQRFESFTPDAPITKSLFSDEESTISEENIQKILDGTLTLPKELRVSIVKLKSNQQLRGYYWANEAYLKSQQAYLDLFTEAFKESGRVERVSAIPEILLSSNPTYTNIRESAVRTQSDIVAIYSINSDIYSKYKLFSKNDIKAFATTQLIILDVRTGLIPFSTIVTKDFQSKKEDKELNNEEAANRIKDKAVLLTIEEIGTRLKKFLKNE